MCLILYPINCLCVKGKVNVSKWTRIFSFVENMKTLAILLFGILYIQNGLLCVTVKAHFKVTNSYFIQSSDNLYLAL